MIWAVGISVIEDRYLTSTSRTVAHAPSLFPTIDLFYGICPDKVKYRRTIRDCNRLPNALKLILVELEVLRLLPFVPIILF